MNKENIKDLTSQHSDEKTQLYLELDPIKVKLEK